MNDWLHHFPDLLLAAMLLGLGWAAVTTRNLFRGVVLFIAFGLLLSIVWARLHAPDLALAEAAIGAGLAGALLLAAVRDEPRLEAASSLLTGTRLWALNLLALIIIGLFGWALLDALSGPQPYSLALVVEQNLEQSGVSNPVTAVLLNFRAYDTLLELAVVLVAVLGVAMLAPQRPGYRQAGPVLCSLIRWLVPLLIVTAGYLLWVGAHAPGGAFQAGATLAAAAVMLRLGGDDRAGLPGITPLRWLMVAGIGMFLIVGLALIGNDRAFLQYPEAWAGILILLIEAAATLSISAALAVAYLGGRPTGWRTEPSPRVPAVEKEGS